MSKQRVLCDFFRAEDDTEITIVIRSERSLQAAQVLESLEGLSMILEEIYKTPNVPTPAQGKILQ